MLTETEQIAKEHYESKGYNAHKIPENIGAIDKSISKHIELKTLLKKGYKDIQDVIFRDRGRFVNSCPRFFAAGFTRFGSPGLVIHNKF